MLYPKLKKKEKKATFLKKFQHVMCAKRSVLNGLQCFVLFLVKSLHF